MELDQFKLERTTERLKALGVEVALFTEFYNVSYLTGFTLFFENGPHPLSHGLCAALLMPRQVTLVADAPSNPAKTVHWSGSCEVYEGYSYHAPHTPLASYLDAVMRVCKQNVPERGVVGVEMDFLPAALWERLRAARPNVAWFNLPAELMLEVRAVKSHLELEKLRACARLAEVGQEAVRRLVKEPGKSEIEVYSQSKAAMEAYIGERFALQSALHGGMRSSSVWVSMPTGAVLAKGDMLINDMVPYYKGYWGDTCSTYVVGGESAITEAQRKIHRVSRDAFQKGFDAIKPGVTGGQLDSVMRDYVRQQGYDYPHHSGHGLGVSNHEEPRIIVDAPMVLEPGMVIALEPAVYVENFGGVRQERMILVTQDGAELLTKNSFELA